MKINIKATNFDLTTAIKDYVEDKVGSLDKFIPNLDDSVQAWVEVGKTTEHHQSGDIFRAEIQIRLPHVDKGIRSVSEKDGLYSAIDDAREEIKRELLKTKEKRIDLARKGARMFKRLTSFLRE